MADILIKGAEMPKSCYGCTYHHWSNFWQKYVCCSVLREGDPILINEKEVKSTDVLRSGRSDNCPLFEVPPHGRLIDADEFEKKNEYFWHRDFINPKYSDTLEDLVNAAPTIISASEEAK